MTLEEFAKLDLVGREALTQCWRTGKVWGGRLTRVCCDMPQSDPVFQLMASCRKKLADRMGVRGRNVPCVVLECSFVVHGSDTREERNDTCTLFFFPTMKDEHGDDECWCEMDGSVHDLIMLHGSVYLGLNRISNRVDIFSKTPCPQAGQW